METQPVVDHKTTHFTFDQLEETLIYFSTSVGRFKTEQELVWDIVKNCIARLKYPDCVIYFIDSRTLSLVQVAAHGQKNPRDNQIHQPMSIPLGKGICGTVAMTAQAEIIADTSLDSRYLVDDERRLSEITVPILIEGNVIGVIDCEHPEANFFNHQDLRILSAIASICSISVGKLRAENREEAERLKRAAAERGISKMRLQVLNTQLGPHFLFNSINAIQHFLITDNKRPALSYLNLLSRLIRKFLASLDKDFISVAEETTMLAWYLELQQLRYDRFNYQLTVSPDNAREDARMPPFLSQSLVENFLEVLIPQNAGTSNITVQFLITSDEITVSLLIEAQQGNSFNRRLPEYRQGLTQWSDHIEVYNRIKKYDISYTIEDQMDENDLLIARKVELKMPNLA